MFSAVGVGIILLDGWGMIGIWTQVRSVPYLLWLSLTCFPVIRVPQPMGVLGIRKSSPLDFVRNIANFMQQVFYGLFVCPWYAYSQTMISEVTPRGKEFLFFSLFSIVGKTSAFIGPLVSSAIIDASPTNNNSSPFYFLFALSLVSFLFIFFFVDLSKSQAEQAEFLAREQAALGKSV